MNPIFYLFVLGIFLEGLDAFSIYSIPVPWIGAVLIILSLSKYLLNKCMSQIAVINVRSLTNRNEIYSKKVVVAYSGNDLLNEKALTKVTIVK